jgi:23S rRNA (adenine2503-C2)-methyltransferase
MAAMTTLPYDSWPPSRLQNALVEAGLRPGQAHRAVTMLGHALWREFLPWDQALAKIGGAAGPKVAELCAAPTHLEVMADERSVDGSHKLLFRTADGEVIESVLIPADSGKRTTLCVSSQVGCGRRCAFCQTGRLGLVRNLTTGEIVAQLRLTQQLWASQRGEQPLITNVVFMGMGEPLDNLDHVADAVAVMTDDLGAGLSWRRVTVSTVGVAWKLPEFFAKVQANLALSLNAPDDQRRSWLMPINERCGMTELKAALLQHLPQGRDVLVEYVLMAGVNDATADADLLIAWMQGLAVRVNLIPANAGPVPALRAPDREAIQAFQKYLLDRGVRTMVRWSHGGDLGGACGQLAGEVREMLRRGERVPVGGLVGLRRATAAAA